jgi:hypothetical protein
MSKQRFAIAASSMFLLAGVMTFTAPANKDSVRLTGYVTDTWCGVNRDTKAPSVECTKECVQDKGAQYAFYDTAANKVYILNPQSLAAKYAGQPVTVSGTIDATSQKFATMRGESEGLTLTATSISPK